MTRLPKFLGYLLVLILSYFAIAPYWPTVKRELANAITYKQGQQTDTPSVSAPREAETDVATESTQRRTLLKPEHANVQVAEVTDTEDPFLSEVRNRTRENPEAAMTWLHDQYSGEERLRGMLEVVALWAAEDSESALLWLESNAQGIARIETLDNGVGLWSQRDPIAAADWIDGMANDRSKATAAKSLTRQWSTESPEAAAAWVMGLERGPVQDAAATGLVQTWSKSDPERALVWVLNDVAPEQHDELLQVAISEFAEKSASNAEAFIRSVADVYDGELLAEKHLQALAENEPRAAADWFSNLPPDDSVFGATGAATITRVWAQTDSIATSAWLSELPTGPTRDQAILGFADSVAIYEPEAATAWANTISNPNLRIDQLRKSLEQWGEADPEEAEDWINSAELEQDLRQQLNSIITSHPTN